MNKKIGLFILLYFIVTSIGFSQEVIKKGLNVISEQSSKAILTYLASDWMEGREPGTKGHAIAADYLASMFQSYGLKPVSILNDPYSIVDNRFFPNNKYFQNFSLTKLKESNDHELSIVTRKGKLSTEEYFNYKIDFVTSDFIGHPSRSLVGEIPIVFVGYGLVDEKAEYDDYKGIDVKGKIVLRLRGYPGHNDTSSIAYKRFKIVRKSFWQYMNFEYNKNKFAKQHGAIACIEVNIENEALSYQATNIYRYNWGRYESDTYLKDKFFTLKYVLKDSLKKSLIGYTVSQRFANELTNETGISIADFERTVKNTLKPASQEIKNKLLKINCKANFDLINCRNIIGMIEGENPNEIVVVGAHYDHLGKFNGIIYNGSDDNASGTIAVLEIAKACLATGVKPKRTILFAAWDAEEIGLLGSNYFVNNPTHKKIIANVNFDMISRNPPNDSLKSFCSVSYTKPFEVFRTNTEKFITENNLNLKIQYNAEENPKYGTDSYSFAENNIPIICFETGIHKDYHKPSDHSSRANITKMTDIIRLGFLNVWELANIEELK